MSETNYSIDLKAAKGTKLFKKFLQSKNKTNNLNVPRPESPKQQTCEPFDRNLNIQMNYNPSSYPIANTSHQKQARYYQEMKQRSQQTQQFQQNKLGTFTFNHISKPVIQERKTERVGFKSDEASRKREFQREFQNNYRHTQKLNSDPPISNPTIYTQETSPTKPALYMPQSDEPIDIKKYRKLAEEYEQLSRQVASERKSHKIETLRLQEEVESLKKKVYELGSKEDDLILENRRLKQRNQAENKSRVQLEESQRELGYQVQELKDMVDGNQESLNKKDEQIAYLRKANEEMRQSIKFLAAENQKYKDHLNVFERERNTVDREKETKQIHIQDLRDKISSVINDNSILKDQLFHLTTKLYQMEQQNKTLKADLRRHGDQFPMEYLYEQMNQSAYQNRIQAPTRENINVSNQSQYNHLQPDNENPSQLRQARRGEYAQERKTRRNRRQFAQEQQMRNPVERNEERVEGKDLKREYKEKLRRFEQLQDEVQKLKDSKAMNGAMRRQKITLEREIQQIEEYLKAQNSQN